jgi:signal transduction histidine kinase/CheY-like chemotaxis protein
LEWVHPEDRPKVEAQLEQLLEPSRADDWRTEFRIMHPDKGITWMQVLGHAFRRPDGSIAETLGIALDITQRKSVEQELAEARRLEAVGLVAASVSHDFNNLLAVISGNLELAMPRIADDAARRLAGRAAEAAKLGGSYNRRLLSSLRPSRPAAVPVDVNERARELVKLLENVIGRNVSITAKLDPALWTVSADPGEIDGALLNLAINARDAMPNGGSILIETSNVTLGAREAEALHPGARTGDYVRLSVTDNGIGMPEAVLRQVLTPFFTTKPEGAGTGLGLTSVAGFAGQAGGFFSIVSAPGEGCAASIHLPRAASAASAAERPKAPAGAAAVPVGDGELVLVVEDDDRVREVTLRRLESLGYAVEEARSGPEAVRWLESGQPVRAVLSDIVMPGGMSGRDLANWIGANRPGIGVVLCSGYDKEAFGAGRAMAPFERIVLTKPFTREELAVAVRRAIDRAAAQSSRTAAASP